MFSLTSGTSKIWKEFYDVEKFNGYEDGRSRKGSIHSKESSFTKKMRKKIYKRKKKRS